MLPFPGIINGLLVPTLLVPPYFFALSAQETLVYLLRGIIHNASFILCEREKLAQLVSGEYAAQESAEIGKISALDNRDSNAFLFQQHDNADYIGQR